MVRKVTAELLPMEEEIIDVDVKDPRNNTSAEKQEDEWADFLSGAGETAMVYVYRQPNNGQSPFEFVDSFPADQFEPAALMKRLRNEFGGGNYRVQIRQGGRVRGNKLMAVAGKVESTGLAVQGDPAVMALLGELRDMRREMLEAKKQENKSPIEQIKEMAALASVMREAFGVGQQQKSMLSELKELVALQNEFKGMFGGGDEDKEPGWTSIIAPLVQALPALLGAGQPRPPVYQSNPQARPVPPNQPPTGANTVPNLTPEQQQLAPHVAKMVFTAEIKSDPAMMAEKLCEAVDQYPQLEHALLLPDIIDRLTAINPAVEKHREWFIDVLEWTKALLGHDSKYKDEVADEDEPETPQA